MAACTLAHSPGTSRGGCAHRPGSRPCLGHGKRPRSSRRRSSAVTIMPLSPAVITFRRVEGKVTRRRRRSQPIVRQANNRGRGQRPPLRNRPRRSHSSRIATTSGDDAPADMHDDHAGRLGVSAASTVSTVRARLDSAISAKRVWPGVAGPRPQSRRTYWPGRRPHAQRRRAPAG